MAKKKMTRKELLKGPDEFLTFSGRAFIFFNEHTRLLQYIGIGIAIIVVAYLAVNTYIRHINKKATEVYDTAYLLAAKTMQPEAKPADLKKSQELFEKLKEEHGFAKSSKLAFPQLAYGKFVDGKYDEAISLYKDFLKKVEGNQSYESLTNLALAACYEAKGDFKSAISILNPVLMIPDHPFKETAMLNLARLYRLDNNPDKEKEILKQFVEAYGDSPFLAQAKARL
jgi:predicted negative regulator of RcsB-dependent stress response